MGRALEVTAPAAQALLASLVDYAGLFPPAGLPMAAAVAEYARWHAAPERWMLARFVCPAAQLEALAAELPPSTREPWRVTALLGDTVADLGRVARFNCEHGGRARVEAIELKAATPEEIAAAGTQVPKALAAYIELPLISALDPLVGAVHAAGAWAKVRTGGVTADAIPSAADLARFIATCAAAGLPFKATAGLHHALRSEQPLTYAVQAPRATMHGFVNVFAAAVFARAGATADVLESLLEERDPSAFRFGGDGLAWREWRASSDEISRCRAAFAISFGSCSFAEPVAELRELELLP